MLLGSNSSLNQINLTLTFQTLNGLMFLLSAANEYLTFKASLKEPLLGVQVKRELRLLDPNSVHKSTTHPIQVRVDPGAQSLHYNRLKSC